MFESSRISSSSSTELVEEPAHPGVMRAGPVEALAGRALAELGLSFADPRREPMLHIALLHRAQRRVVAKAAGERPKVPAQREASGDFADLLVRIGGAHEPSASHDAALQQPHVACEQDAILLR